VIPIYPLPPKKTLFAGSLTNHVRSIDIASEYTKQTMLEISASEYTKQIMLEVSASEYTLFQFDFVLTVLIV
jgi:hypothetical protein